MFKAILLNEHDGKVTAALTELPQRGGDVLMGRVRGRVVIDVRA